MSSILKSHGSLPYYNTRPQEAAKIATAAGLDISPFFRHALSPICQQDLTATVSLICSSPAFPGSIYCHNWDTVSPLLSQIAVGPVYYGWDDMKNNTNMLIFDGKVLDLSLYFGNPKPLFGPAIDAVLRSNLGLDATKALAAVNHGPEIGLCLVDLYSVGRLEANSTGCWASQVILYVSFAIVMGLVLVRFMFAVYFRWVLSNQLGKILKDTTNRTVAQRRINLEEGKFPITMTDFEGNMIGKHQELVSPFGHASIPRKISIKKSKSTYGSELHTIMLVTCYSEDEASLKLTFDSLAATEYNEDFKLLLIIADGIIKGSGNEKSTPDLILDLLELDANWQEPKPMSYLAVADGAKQHNMAKVYVAWYNLNGKSVPTILIVKTGLESETQKPGNRYIFQLT